MPQHVKDFSPQNSLTQEISKKEDSDEDLYFDEELDSYLNQLEAIPIELLEENGGGSSEGSKGDKNAFIEGPQAASRNASDCAECPGTAEDTEPTSSISSFTTKTDINGLRKKGQEEESKLAVATINSRMGSESEHLSIEVCGQMISRSRQKTAGADTLKNVYGKCKEDCSDKESFSTSQDANRLTSSEKSPARAVIIPYVERVSKSKTDLPRTKRRRKRKERDYNRNSLSGSRTKNSVSTEKITEDSISSTQEQGRMKTDIFYCMETACRLEAVSSVPQKKYCDGSNDDKNLISFDSIKTETNIVRFRRDSSSSLSSFSSRETVILPFEDPRLCHRKGELRCTSPGRLKTCVLVHSSSSENLSQSADAICVMSEREPSPFPLSKATSDIASCQIVSDVIETNNDIALSKADHFKTSSDCTKISSETCESDPILTQKGSLTQINSEHIDFQRQSSSPSLSPTTESQLKSDSFNGECEGFQAQVIAGRRGPRTPSPCTPTLVTVSDLSTIRGKSLTPSPPRYSRSASVHGMFHKPKISPVLVSTEQQTDKLETPKDWRSDCAAKVEVESTKPRDKVHGSDLVQGTKLYALKDNKATSISPERNTVDSKSLSPGSSCSVSSPVKKKSRSRTVDCKSTSSVSSSSSSSPVKKRSRSRTVDCKSTSPTSSSSSSSPVKKGSRSRTMECKSTSPVSISSLSSPVKKGSRSRTVDCKSMSPISISSLSSPVNKRSRSRTVDCKSTSPVSSKSSSSPVKKGSRSRTVDYKSTSPTSSCSSSSLVKKGSRSGTVDYKSTSPTSSCSSSSPVKKGSRSRTVDYKSTSPTSSCSSSSLVKKGSRSGTVDYISMSSVSSGSLSSPVKKGSRPRTVDYKSTSPVSSCSSYSPVRKRSRSRRQRSSRSQSRCPYRYWRRSRSMSPSRRKWKSRRSHSRSVSPPRLRSRLRTPRRRRARSRSPVITRYCISRSRIIKSRSPSRGLWSPRRGSRSPRRGSRSPRRGSQSPRRYSRSPRRGSRSPRRGSRSPRRYSRSPRRVPQKRRRKPSSLSLSTESAAEKRMWLKEKTETALSTIVAALNGTQTTATAVSATNRHNASAASTVRAMPSGALPTMQQTQVQ